MAAAEFDNAAIVRRYWDLVWNRGDLSAIDDLVDDNFTNFGVRQPGAHAVVRHIVTAWRTAFPDLHYEIRQEIVQDDKVVHQVVVRGTHLGEFKLAAGPSYLLGTLSPTGRSFEADQIHIHRVEDGRIVEHAATRNDLLMLTQLGLAPSLQPAT